MIKIPFLAFYALRFALGREPGLALELAGYGPLALIPLSLAYAVVKHRLMDVELLFRRALGYVLAVAVIVGLALLTVGVTDVLWEEPHTTLIALLSVVVVVLAFTPVKARIMEALDWLSSKDRYSSRRALVRLAVPWVEGLHRRGASTLYVSRGTGFWGPPLRPLAPAETTELVLRPEEVA